MLNKFLHKIDKAHRVDKRIKSAVNKRKQIKENTNIISKLANGGNSGRSYYLQK